MPWTPGNQCGERIRIDVCIHATTSAPRPGVPSPQTPTLELLQNSFHDHEECSDFAHLLQAKRATQGVEYTVALGRAWTSHVACDQ